MKQTTLLLILGFPLMALAASQDFVSGVDFSARTNLTYSSLNQSVNNATVATNRGLVIVTNGAPNVSNDPKLKRFIWLDTSVNPPAQKTYNTNSGAWESTTINAGSVGTLQLADAAVSTVKIANSAVDNSKIADDSVTSAKIVDGTIVAGDLAASSVTREKIFAGAVGGTQLTNGAVDGTKIISQSISNSHLAIGFNVFNTNIAAGSINNSNLQANSILATNIADNTVSNNHLTSRAVTYQKLDTNATYLLPCYILFIDSAGTIVSQVKAPNLTASTALSTATGNYTINFGTSLSFTNYSASITPVRNTGTATVMITTNGVSQLAYRFQSVAPADIAVPHMVIVYGF